MIIVKGVLIARSKEERSAKIHSLGIKYPSYLFVENNAWDESIIISGDEIDLPIKINDPIFAIDAKHLDGTELSEQEGNKLMLDIGLDVRLGLV